MTYEIVFTSKAKLEFNETAIWWAENRSLRQAARWLEEMEVAIRSLAENPERHQLAREDEHFPFSLRQFLYGVSTKPTHRILYRIRDKQIIIYGIRHIARRDLSPDDI